MEAEPLQWRGLLRATRKEEAPERAKETVEEKAKAVARAQGPGGLRLPTVAGTPRRRAPPEEAERTNSPRLRGLTVRRRW